MNLFKKIIGYLVAIILTIVIMRSCTKPKEILVPRDIFRDRIIDLNKSKDSTEAHAKYLDSVRVKVVYKYRTIKKDTVIYRACEELILVCDSIIVVDSTENASLRHINKLNDSIISDYKKIVHSDTLDINCLKKEIRKQKWLKRVIIAAWALREGAGIVK